METLAYIGPLPDALQNEGIRRLLSLSLPGAVKLENIGPEVIFSQRLRGIEHFREVGRGTVTPGWVADVQDSLSGISETLGPDVKFRFRHPAFRELFDWSFPDRRTIVIESTSPKEPQA